MSKTYTTKTASLKATTADIRKINIDGNPFSKVKDTREVITENDLWANTVTTDENGVVIVTQGATIDGTDWSDINGYDRKQNNDGTKTITKVENNKAYNGNTFLFNIETNAIENGDRMFYVSELASFDGNLSSLTDGSQMFDGCTDLASFNGDLSNLTNGRYMFYDTALQSFEEDLSNLTDGSHMFYYCTSLESFSGDLLSLTDGSMMFYMSALASWDNDLPNLSNGSNMFQNTPLKSFNGDLLSLTNGNNMFDITDLTSFNSNLSNLTSGGAMFFQTALESFNSNLSNLVYGGSMFYKTNLTSFNNDLSSLTYGSNMFQNTPLTSFDGDLSSLTYGDHMFAYSALASFSGDLSSLTDGDSMFYKSALTSFNGDLSNLVYGGSMFYNTHERTYEIDHYKMVNGVKTLVETEVKANGLKSFISNLSSLKSGYAMFGYSSTTCSPLDEESIMLIADTINDISSLNKSVESNWKYTYHNGSSTTTTSIQVYHRGILHLGYDSSITDTTNIFKYCNEIYAKGWTVYLNGSSTPYTPSNPAALIDGESSTIPIPHYYKPVQVTDEDVAEYVDGNGNLYIIVGAQHVFGDDISTYGIFTSYEHAITEISISLGLTHYIKPTEEES